MYREQFGEFVHVYWGLKGLSKDVFERCTSKILPGLWSCPNFQSKSSLADTIWSRQVMLKGESRRFTVRGKR